VWRREPEIDGERQVFLAQRRAIVPDVRRGAYAFGGVSLTRADVEWLLATHDDGRGPVDWSDEAQRARPGLDLRGADLRGANLRHLPLANLLGGLVGATAEQRAVAAINLEGADLRQAHLEGADLRQAHLEGADLRQAHLEGATLDGVYAATAQFVKARLTRCSLRAADFPAASFRDAHMQNVRLDEAHLENATLSGARLEGSNIVRAHLESATIGGARLQACTLRLSHFEGAKLFGAHLENASLSEVYLQGALLRRAHLEGADLSGAHLEGVRLDGDALARIRRWKPDFPEVLPAADIGLAFFDAGTVLEGATLGDDRFSYVCVADVRWGDVNLSVVRWSQGRRRRPVRLGDERAARRQHRLDGKPKSAAERLADYETAVRAYRQLALALQAQGLNEDAARFAYRAQVLQRAVLRRQGRVGSWLFSHLLDVLAGYGYKPGRSLVAYVVVVVFFAAAYFVLGQTHGSVHFAPDTALVFSVTSFHGRGFFPGGVSLEDPITKVAAAEALVGLLIEISFIATFTQRFFGK
jgi:uncharacterized protein YjbI with pentapeptide repeats